MGGQTQNIENNPMQSRMERKKARRPTQPNLILLYLFV
jgi:hypothetical protein